MFHNFHVNELERLGDFIFSKISKIEKSSRNRKWWCIDMHLNKKRKWLVPNVNLIVETVKMFNFCFLEIMGIIVCFHLYWILWEMCKVTTWNSPKGMFHIWVLTCNWSVVINTLLSLVEIESSFAPKCDCQLSIMDRDGRRISFNQWEHWLCYGWPITGVESASKPSLILDRKYLKSALEWKPNAM